MDITLAAFVRVLQNVVYCSRIFKTQIFDRFFWNETIARAGALKQLEQWVSYKLSSNSLLLDIFCEIIMKQKDKITSKQQQVSQRVTTSTTMHCVRAQE